jgi:hypothetical protein
MVRIIADEAPESLGDFANGRSIHPRPSCSTDGLGRFELAAAAEVDVDGRDM